MSQELWVKTEYIGEMHFGHLNVQIDISYKSQNWESEKREADRWSGETHIKMETAGKGPDIAQR